MSLTNYLQPNDVSKLSADQNISAVYPYNARNLAPSPLDQSHNQGSIHLNTVTHHSHKDQHSVASHLNSIANPSNANQFHWKQNFSHPDDLVAVDSFKRNTSQKQFEFHPP